MKIASIFAILFLLLGCAKKYSDMDPDEQLLYRNDSYKSESNVFTTANWSVHCKNEDNAINLAGYLTEIGYPIKSVKFSDFFNTWEVDTEEIAMEHKIKILRAHRKILENASSKYTCSEVLAGISWLKQPNQALKAQPSAAGDAASGAP